MGRGIAPGRRVEPHMNSSFNRMLAVLGLGVVLAVATCSNPDNPQAPQDQATVSGTVVFNQSGDPAAGVQVDLERCANGRGMMGSDEWDHMEDVMTDANGHFKFHYMQQSMHRYRVGIHGSQDPDGMCYLDDVDPHGMVLRVP